jgi:T-complex protein 1 subunit gamma
MKQARNVLTEPLLLPGGGAVEMHIAQALKEHADKVVGSEQWPFAAVGDALEVIPRTLCQNCGGDTVSYFFFLITFLLRNIFIEKYFY